MASKVRGPEDRGKMRVRFLEVELEGSNESLLEGIRQITAATATRTVVRHVLAPKTITAGRASNEHELDAPVEDAELDEAPEQEIEKAAAPRRPRAARPGKAPPLSVDLRTDEGPVTLTDYCGNTKVSAESSIMDKAVVVAGWLRDERHRDAMSASDLYTCCKIMDWDPPIDTTSPMRNLKRDDKMKSEGRGKFALTMLGDKHLKALRK